MRIILLLSILFLPLTIFTQTSYPCLFDEHTNSDQLLVIEQNLQRSIQRLETTPRSTDSLRIIPVVVHVIHNGGSENISEAQIQSQIQVLNEDFSRLPNTNGYGSGVDTKVRFFLANIDPDGHCTNGIVRIKSTLTRHQSYQRPLLKQLSFWDNDRYMNIYIVRSINGNVAGYSSFPDGPAEEDGIVVQHTYFGNIGSANRFLGRTATHEVGHWLGIYHTFNNACGEDVCTDGDYVCDTPPAMKPNFTCNRVNTCDNDTPDLPDLYENYMDYSPGSCKNMFTEGQKMRMHASLVTFRPLIWSDDNLLATGYDSVYTVPADCAVKADFVTLTPEICSGNPVYFADISLNDVKEWHWSFPGGNPSTSTEQNPTIKYENEGEYDVQLIVVGENSTDTVLRENFITVVTPGIGEAIPFREDFESGNYLTSSISLNNQDGGITWEIDSAAAKSGKYSFRINNLINTNYGSVDEILLPDLDLSSISGSIYMSFNWAYAKSDPQFSDDLLVLLTTNCGNTFIRVFSKSGNSLATGPTQTTPFIPDSTQWKSAKIRLDRYKDEQFVQIKIVNVTDGGNNLYIDDIYVGNGDIPVATKNIKSLNINLKTYPSPVTDQLNIEITTDKSRVLSYKLIDTRGISVFNKSGVQYDKGLHFLTIPTSSIPDGLYFLQWESQGRLWTQKVIVQH